MKLEKLLTLSQFLEYLRKFKFHDFRNVNLAEKYRYTEKYNNFLKQPLTKEMFVGNKSIIDDEKYDANWFELEAMLIRFETLGHLAEATKGQLKLKNVEI